VLEQTRLPDSMKPDQELNHYAVRHLQRFPLGISYPEVIAVLEQLFADPTLSRTPLIVDQTAVGSPVVKMLKRSSIQANVRPITITAGQATGSVNGGSAVPKMELVSTLQVLLQSRRLEVAGTLAEAPTLVKELMNFKMKVKLVADVTLSDWREGIHDDLVLAVAIAAWQGELYQEIRWL
jgi:hypothetical protein